MMSRKNWAQVLVQAVIVVAAMTAGGLLAVNVGGGGGAPSPAVVSPSPPPTLPLSSVVTPAPPPVEAAPDVAAAPFALADIVDDVRRSVVAIRTTTVGSTGGSSGRQFRAEGEGAGIVIDVDGHILTNYHVIENADELSVLMWDGTVARAQVVGADPMNDLAVIRASIQPQRLTPARFGDSDAVRVGETVFAIGNPFQFDFSVTRGIVSGLGRESGSDSASRPIRGVIQIDAAVNPGNSGGPLFNSRGEVIGINTAIHNPTQQRVFVGVGLAVPSNTALRFMPDMIAGRDITHPQLGISGLTLNALNASDVGVDVDRGVYVTGVAPDGAADSAGLRAASIGSGGALLRGGDVITAIDGFEVPTMQELARLIDLHDVGDEITLTVVRGGERLEIIAKLQQWPGG
jgi:putative serine protease PepD